MASFVAAIGTEIVEGAVGLLADNAEIAAVAAAEELEKRAKRKLDDAFKQVMDVDKETAEGETQTEAAVVASSPVEGLATDHDKLGRPLLSSSKITTQLYQLRQLMWMVARPYMLQCGKLNRVTSQGMYKLNCKVGTGNVEQPVHIWELNTCQVGSSAAHAVVHKLQHNGTWARYNNTTDMWLMQIYDQFGYMSSHSPVPKMAMLQNLKINLNFRGRVNRPTKYTVMIVTDFSPSHQPDDPLTDGADTDDTTWALWVKNTLGRLTYNPIVSHYQHKQGALPFRVLYHKNVYVKENTNGQDAMITYPMTIDYHVNKLYDFWHYNRPPAIDTDHGTTKAIDTYTPDTTEHLPSRRPAHPGRMYMMVLSTDYMNTDSDGDSPSYDCMFYSKWLKPAMDV